MRLHKLAASAAALGLLATACQSAVAGRARGSDPNSPPVPIYGYNSLGFGYAQAGVMYAIGRNGSRHWSDPTGRVVRFTVDIGKGVTKFPPQTLIDTSKDDRGPAGGPSQTGSVIFFYQRSEPSDKAWLDMWAARLDGGRVTQTQIPVDGDISYSAYGPLITLPGGRLLQTVYGWNAKRYRVRVFSSDNDGRNWTVGGIIDSNKTTRPTETAVAFVGGTTAGNSRLVAVTKSERTIKGKYFSYLTQYDSIDGGKKWWKAGDIGVTKGEGTVSPWIASAGEGRLALVWIDRKNYVVNVSIAKADDIFKNPGAWPAPRWIYRSRLWGHPGVNFSDFGYPSVISMSPNDKDKYVMFYDSHSGDSGLKPVDIPSDVDIMLRPLFERDIRHAS